MSSTCIIQHKGFVHSQQRRGSATVLGLALTVMLVILVGITIDSGVISVSQAELRRSADAASMAACWEMYDQALGGDGVSASHSTIAAAACEAAQANSISSEAPQLAASDVELGSYDYTQKTFTSNSADPNAIRVKLRRQSSVNGEVPLFFGAMTGRDSQSLFANATAAMFRTIDGFEEPPDSSTTINILPIALDLPTWEDVLAGSTSDSYSFDGTNVSGGSDGIPECNLYPKGNGSPGNRGTVDIGGANNSTSDLSRQILHGISQQDFVDLGKPLEFTNGELELNGDTGISAGIKDELASIIGQTRIIPIFTQVNGNGNNATYTIVRFEGVRILDVKLTGKKNKKHLTIQPAKVLARGAKISTSATSRSEYLYTPVMLVD